MRVYDQIRRKAIFREWHVFLGKDDSHDSFLAVVRRKLVPDLGCATSAEDNLRSSGTILVG